MRFLMIIGFILCFCPTIAQDNSLDSTTLLSSAEKFIIGNSSTREWVFESYDIDMSLANKCYSGGSFIFNSDHTLKIRTCIDSKLIDEQFDWKLKFQEPHHIILSIQNGNEYYLNIYEDNDREDVLWMELTSIDIETDRFSKYYHLIYTPN